MSEFNFWDFSNVEVKDNSLIPEGVYKVTCVIAETKLSKADKPMLSCKFSIDEGTHAGRFIYENLMMGGVSDQAVSISQQKVMAFLTAATGKTKDQLIAEGGKHERMIGKSCLASVKINPEKDGYKESNRISYFKALSKEQKEQASNGVPF